MIFHNAQLLVSVYEGFYHGRDPLNTLSKKSLSSMRIMRHYGLLNQQGINCGFVNGQMINV
jgi:hypothetical protein